MPKKAPKKPTEEQPKEVSKIVKKVGEVTSTTLPPKKTTIVNTNVRPKEVVEKIGPSKTKRFGEDKYEKISEKAGVEKFREMGQKVQGGTLQWAYFAIDGDSGVGYHYYLKKV